MKTTKLFAITCGVLAITASHEALAEGYQQTKPNMTSEYPTDARAGVNVQTQAEMMRIENDRRGTPISLGGRSGAQVRDRTTESAETLQEKTPAVYGEMDHYQQSQQDDMHARHDAAVEAQSLAGVKISQILTQDEVMVKLSGTVQSIDDDDEFTLADNTGKITVEMNGSNYNPTLGEEVVVIGNVDDDMFSTEVEASHIIRQ